jgi:hypothetical protein
MVVKMSVISNWNWNLAIDIKYLEEVALDWPINLIIFNHRSRSSISIEYFAKASREKVDRKSRTAIAADQVF